MSVVVDRLVQQNRKNAEKKKRQQLEEDEEWMTYAVRQRMTPINKDKGVFPEESSGINTRESVFDRTAIFRTQGDE